MSISTKRAVISRKPKSPPVGDQFSSGDRRTSIRNSMSPPVGDQFSSNVRTPPSGSVGPRPRRRQPGRLDQQPAVIKLLICAVLLAPVCKASFLSGDDDWTKCIKPESEWAARDKFGDGGLFVAPHLPGGPLKVFQITREKDKTTGCSIEPLNMRISEVNDKLNKKGLKVGMKIVKVNEHKVHDFDEYCEAICERTKNGNILYLTEFKITVLLSIPTEAARKQEIDDERARRKIEAAKAFRDSSKNNKGRRRTKTQKAIRPPPSTRRQSSGTRRQSSGTRRQSSGGSPRGSGGSPRGSGGSPRGSGGSPRGSGARERASTRERKSVSRSSIPEPIPAAPKQKPAPTRAKRSKDTKLPAQRHAVTKNKDGERGRPADASTNALTLDEIIAKGIREKKTRFETYRLHNTLINSCVEFNAAWAAAEAAEKANHI